MKNVVMFGLAVTLVPAVQNAALEEREPACGIEARPQGAGLLGCPEKQPQQQHIERDTTPPTTYQPSIGATFTPTYPAVTGISVTAA
jgi:hypothetical protein